MIATTEAEIKALRIAGRILAGVLQDTAALCKDGVSAAELDLVAERAIRSRGAIPSFLNYKPEGSRFPYPATLCVSINDEITHGLPNADKIIRNGDLVSLDTGLSYDGFFVDAAITICVGTCDPKGERLIAAAHEALMAAIAVVRPGNRIGDIGGAVTAIARKYEVAIVEDLGGHAVGRAVHERPFIANDGKVGEGEEIVEGMVLALEPMFAEGKGAIVLEHDEWTYSTEDGSRSTTFEHTILVTKNGAEILTTL
jgi:methionyl aminopeptidase